MRIVLNGLFGILKAKNNPQNITVGVKNEKLILRYSDWSITKSHGRIMHVLLEKYILY